MNQDMSDDEEQEVAAQRRAAVFGVKLQKYSFSPASSSKNIKAGVAGLSTPSPRPARRPSSATQTGSAKRRRPFDDDTDEYNSVSGIPVALASPSPSLASPSSSPATPKRKEKNGKKPRPFAAPEVYAHLRGVPDHMANDLDILFCGINPGKRSSTEGHHFAHPTNKFYRALHQSGLTDRQLSPSEDHLMPSEYNYGLTNLVDRPTSEQSELSSLEMRLNVLSFSRKLIKYRPQVVCMVGKKIWDMYESVAIKAARPAVPPSVKLEVKLERLDGEDNETYPESVSEEWEMKPVLPSPKRPPGNRAPMAKRPKEFDWTKPRSLRLPMPIESEDEVQRYCYFWVTPSTSGLERTSFPEMIERFSHLRSFLLALKREELPDVDFLDIEMDGVEKVTIALREAADKKASQP